LATRASLPIRFSSVIGTFAAAGTVSFVIWLLQLRTA
jgi:hypothetical protein